MCYYCSNINPGCMSTPPPTLPHTPPVPRAIVTSQHLKVRCASLHVLMSDVSLCVVLCHRSRVRVSYRGSTLV